MAELAGLQKALKVVDTEADRVRAHGLTTFTFFLGFATCMITAFLIGKYPESVWIVYAAEAFLILGWRVSRDLREKASTLFYFFDFCWISNFTISLLCSVTLFQVLDELFLGDTFPNLDLGSRFPNTGRIICLISTGPLGWSVILLSNALMLHDLDNFSSCFIHLWPSLTTLSVRWNPAAVMAAYPGHFDSLVGFLDPPAGADLLGLVKVGAVAYFAWWVPFALWMLAHGRHQSPKKTGWDTIYINLVMTNPVARSTLGISSDAEQMLADAAGIAATLKYLVIHAMLCMLSLLFSAYCYKHMWLHFTFCVVLVCVALYNASKKYEWMLTQRYSGVIRKHIAKEFPAEAPLTKKGN